MTTINKQAFWTFEATGQPHEASPLYDLVVATLKEHPAGPAYMQGPGKSEPHAEMVSFLATELTAQEQPDETIQAAIAMLDHIQQNGVNFGWFKSTPIARSIAVKCDKSLLPQATAERIQNFYLLEEAIHTFLETTDQSPLSKLGCIVSLLITRCAVTQRATLDACMVALAKPIMATKSWWYLDIQHHSGKNQRLERRRIYLEPVTAAALMRWQSDFRSHLDNIETRKKQQAVVTKAFSAFAKAACLPREFDNATARDAATGWLATVLPGFLNATVTRRRITHSLPNSVWRRLQGLVPGYVSEPTTHTVYSDPTKSEVPIQDITSVRPLLDLLEAKTLRKNLSGLSGLLPSLPKNLQILGEWLQLKVSTYQAARAVVLIIGVEIIGALEGYSFPLSDEEIAEIRAVISEDIKADETLDLAGNFVDWLATSGWAKPILNLDLDEDKPGVSVNILSPSELQSILEHLEHASSGVADDQLREIIRTILQLGCIGMRRAEAMKLRVMDYKTTTDTLNSYPLLHLIPYPERRLKSVSSRRYVPARLLHPELQAALGNAPARAPEEMLISAYEISSLSDQTIWLTANRILQQYLQDAGLHLHHCRHTAATQLLLQLMAAPLGVHRYWGRCDYLDSLLAGADQVAETLTLSNPSSLGHLRAVSILLGHLDPLITLKTYIHCCDWLTYFALDRSGEPGYTELLARASGRPVSTVKNHQDLGPQVRQHLSQRALLTPYHRTSDGWSLLHQVEREFPSSVSRDDTPMTHTKAQKRDGPVFANVSELMVQLERHPTPEESATLSATTYLSGEGSQKAPRDLPILRAGLMTSIASDWTTRLHKALLQLTPDKLENWKSSLSLLAMNIDTHRSIIRMRKEPGTEAIIDVLRLMQFKIHEWNFRPPQEKGGPKLIFRPFRTWRNVLATGRPLHLRPTYSTDGFSYEGARWAVIAHLLYLEFRII